MNNSVRIIGGIWRGRRIAFDAAAGIRPTPDRVRETLFNWLRNEIRDARCLDLFAGSGVLGLEALSRGARHVTFIDSSPAAARMIRDGLKTLGGSGTVIETDAIRWLSAPRPATPTPTPAPGASQREEGRLRADQYDLVFLDPPFGQDWLPRITASLHAGDWIVRGGLVFLESERGAGEPALPSGWEMLKSKIAGEVGYHLARLIDRAKQ